MKNQIKTILLLGVLSALLIALGGVMGKAYLYGFTLLALAMNLGMYFFSDRLVLSMHRAKELSPSEAPLLHATVQELAQQAGIPKPRVYLIPEHQPNAFATGRNPKKGVVAVTQGIMDVLSPRELRGVLAHEIAHIRNRDILVATVAAAIAGAISYLGQALQFGFLFGGASDEEGDSSIVGGLAMALLAPIIALLIQMGVSRSREYLADETGARISGDPEALASALEKLDFAARRVPAGVEPATASLFIVNPFAGAGSMMNLFSTHPPMRERIRRLRSMRGTAVYA
ncbi:MAG TPA: zinc metalloprotease HtpX [Terriglobales bacterium]|nr:zinc metalloprotease HtpX [Terriglobales bacterium]